MASLGGLKKLVGANLEDIDARQVNSIPIGRTDERHRARGAGRPVRPVRAARRRAEAPASVPEDLPPDELTVEKALELRPAPSGDRVLGTDPTAGYEVVAKAGPLRPVRDPGAARGLQGQAADGARCSPRWPSTRSPSSRRCTLLTLPRVLGTAEDGEEVSAQNGRYGPYVSKGTDSRSLEWEEALFTVTLDEALACSRSRSGAARRAAPNRR